MVEEVSESLEIIDAIVAAIAVEVSPRPVGTAAPATLPKAYVVVQPITSPEPEGDMGSHYRNQDLNFNIQSYGEDVRQAVWVRDRVRSAMATVKPSIAAAQWVRPGSRGAIVPAGERHYLANDTYVVRI